MVQEHFLSMNRLGLHENKDTDEHCKQGFQCTSNPAVNSLTFLQVMVEKNLRKFEEN